MGRRAALRGPFPVETTQVTAPGGRTPSYVCDPLNSGRMLSQADGLITRYAYDPYGNLASQTDPAGNQTQ